jgi:hypothetical protein
VTTETHAEIRITRLECVDGTWRFAFTCPDAEAFASVVDAVKALPLMMRRWDPQRKHWLISDEGMRILAEANPPLAVLMATAQRRRREETEARERAQREARAQAQEEARRRQQQQQQEDQARWRDRFNMGSDPFGYRQQAYTHSIPPAVATAFASLFVTPNAPLSVIQAAYRALAKEAHPDTGGSHDRMKAINAAFDLASKWAKQQGRASA